MSICKCTFLHNPLIRHRSRLVFAYTALGEFQCQSFRAAPGEVRILWLVGYVWASSKLMWLVAIPMVPAMRLMKPFRGNSCRSTFNVSEQMVSFHACHHIAGMFARRCEWFEAHRLVHECRIIATNNQGTSLLQPTKHC